MPDGWTHLEIAEVALLSLGGGVLFVFLARFASPAFRAWALALRPVADHRLELLDVLVALCVIWLAAPLWLALIAAPAAPGSESAATQAPHVASMPQIVSMVLGQLTTIAVLVVLGRSRFSGGIRAWGLTAAHALRRAGQALLAYVGVWPVCFLTVYAADALLRWKFPSYHLREHTTILTLQSDATPSLGKLLDAAGAVILAPLAEELFFRGLLQPLLARRLKSAWAGILLTAMFFGIFHYPLLHVIVALTILGVLLSYLYARTRSLTLVVLVHALFNAKTVLWIALGARM